MNQDQIKEMLLKIEDTSLEFSVTLTGKKSKKVNGLYKPDTHEILLHNKNFETENQLVYTAIHEYAHHLQCERDGELRSKRSHTAAFWARFHTLLEKAETLGFYTIGIENESDLDKLTQEIREKYLSENGRLMNELGKLLAKAQVLCKEANVRYEDYIDRVLCLPRTAAKTAIKISALELNPSIGYENMKIVARQTNPEIRAAAEQQFLARKSPDTVAAKIVKKDEDEDMKVRLEKEKKRIENTIRNLQARLDQVEQSLSNM